MNRYDSVQRVKVARRLERNAFEEAKECLNDDLNQTLIVKEEAEAREQAAIVDCLHELKVFKFKK